MSIYNKKCNGCGNFFSDKKNSLGYIPKFDPNIKDQLCLRCFKLKHYNQVIDIETPYNHISSILDNLNISNSNVFLIVDILDIKNTIVDINKISSYKKLFIILNKIDRLPKYFNHSITNQNVNLTLQNLGFKNYILIYTSIKNHSSIKRLWKVIHDLPRNEVIHFLGKSNTGKSSLINSLLQINKQNPKLISSPYINTTLDFKKIYISKTHFIIDSPGFIDNSNILNYIKPEYSKLINSNKQITKNFFLSPKQSILIEKLVILNYLEGDKCNFTFYLSDQIKLLRSKLENASSNMSNKEILMNIEYNQGIQLKEIVFDIEQNKKYNISINGLCSISIGYQAKKISILVHPSVEVKINEFAII